MGLTEREPDFEYIRRLVHERAAIVLEDSKSYLVTARLTPLAEREGYQSLGELVETLRKAPSYSPLVKSVVEAMTTNETSFFRDVAPFDAFRSEVLPAITKINASRRQLNMWSAACSSGQEPYSVLIEMREHFPELADWKVAFHASDLSSEMCDRTREGIYSQLEVNRGLPARLLVKYFRRKGMKWQVKDELRKLLVVQEVNLVQPWPSFPTFDVVFMRNVMIYFNVATKRDILARLRRILRPGGFLFLGGAETTLGVDESFERVPFPNASCYRLRD